MMLSVVAVPGGPEGAPRRGRISRTVFVPPGLPRGHVRRPRLRRRLDGVLQLPLAMVVAPAGAGKTTLVREWVEDLKVPWAWATFDPSHRDPTTLTMVLVGVLADIEPRFGVHLESLASGTPPDEDLLAALLDDFVAWVTGDVVVVLDEVDHFDAAYGTEVLARIGQHFPSTLHVVAMSRRAPTWPLPRLRGQGRLLEMSADALAFTDDEAAEILGSAGLRFDRELVAAANERLGGWAAALHLAAGAVSASLDPAESLDRIDASLPDLAALVDSEVLSVLPQHLVDFLSDVVALDVLSADRCDALRDRHDAGDLLRELHAFGVLTPSGAADASVLRPLHDHLVGRLAGSHPDRLVDQRRRAAAQHEARGDLEAAVETLVAAGDFRDALAVLLRHHVALRTAGRLPVMRGWLHAIHAAAKPDPALDLDLGYLAGLTGDFEQAMELLDRAHRSLAGDDDALRRRLCWRRTAVLAHIGQVEDALADEAAALALTTRNGAGANGDEEAEGHAWLQVVRVLAAAGRHDEAAARWNAAIDSVRMVRGSTTHGRIGVLAELCFDQGELRDAAAHADAALGVWRTEGRPLTFSAVDALRTQAMLELEQGRSAEGGALLDEADLLLVDVDLRSISITRTTIARAALLRARGDSEGAIALLEDLRRAWVEAGWPRPGPVLVGLLAAARCRAYLDAGDLTRAQRAVDDLIGRRADAALLKARIALARDDPPAAMALVADGAWNRRQAVEAGIIRALATASDDIAGATAAVEGALDQGLDEGFLFTFVAERKLLPLYRSVAVHRPSPALAALLTAARTEPTERPATRNGALVVPLTGRELEVLRNLGGVLPFAELAAELYVSPNTLKSHLRAIYRKLGVDSRDAAVREGERLGLLPT